MKMSDDYTDKNDILKLSERIFFVYTMVFNNSVLLASMFINILK